jgi:hypothetical protein
MRASANQEKLKQVLTVCPLIVVTTWIRLHCLYFIGSHKVRPSEILTIRMTWSYIPTQRARVGGVSSCWRSLTQIFCQAKYSKMSTNKIYLSKIDIYMTSSTSFGALELFWKTCQKCILNYFIWGIWNIGANEREMIFKYLPLQNSLK